MGFVVRPSSLKRESDVSLAATSSLNVSVVYFALGDTVLVKGETGCPREVLKSSDW